MHKDAALAFFFPERKVRSLSPLSQGNINHTLRVELADGVTWVLQRLHPGVFADAEAVMANMRLVTDCLAANDDATMRFFHLGTNPQGQDRFIDEEGCCWRLLSMIEPSRCLERLENPAQAAGIGRLLGRFHRLTASIPAGQLADPLPGFHVTPRYLHDYDALSARISPTQSDEPRCAGLIEQLRPLAPLLEEQRDVLSERVIHGDPKAANFLFAAEGDAAISLIDLDTVKPGLLLHDLGDCLRSCCNPLGEGHDDIAAIRFMPELFTALMRGYVEQASDLLNSMDRSLLVSAAAVISFELGLRFFSDHLAGNHYFTITWPGQNLHRALVQLQLCQSILEQQQQLETEFRALLGQAR